MAGQVVADLRWAVSGDWADRLDWAPVGPGSSEGMCRLLGEKPNRNMRQEKFLPQFHKLQERLRAELPDEIMGRLEAMDIQNCLCEFSKYEKALWGEGKPKRRYRTVVAA